MTNIDTGPLATHWHNFGTDDSALVPALMVPERLVSPNSWVGHIPFIFWLVAATRPRRYVELGVHTGNSYCAVAQTIQTYGLQTDCFGVDHWFGDEQAGLYSEDVYAELKSWHDPRYSHFSQLLRMSFEDGCQHVDDGSVDLLHIDGLHTYDAVRTDFETWHSKMSDRGIVLFHDTNVRKNDFGVWYYWKEIAARYPTIEFFHSNGLGLAYVGSRPLAETPALEALINAGTRAKDLTEIRAYFARIGQGLVDRLQLRETRQLSEKIFHSLNEELEHIKSLFTNNEADRFAVRADREALLPRALQWDKLSLYIAQSLHMDPNQVVDIFQRLYNGSNQQAFSDRRRLQRLFHRLIAKGTLDVTVRETAAKLLKHLRHHRASATPDVTVGLQDINYEDPEINLIRASGLFDETYYAMSSIARGEGRDPLEHYLTLGELQHIAPSDRFDPAYYARRHPDVVAAGVGLLRHYCLFGKAEGHLPLPPHRRLDLKFLPSLVRSRILLLVGETENSDVVASAWNIARILQATYDVIIFFGKSGYLHPVFAEACSASLTMPDEPAMHLMDRDAVLQRLASEINPAFAIATSDARDYVRCLATAGVGVVQIMNTFSSKIRPWGTVYSFLPWAHRLVFPSRLVQNSFVRDHPIMSQRRLDILPPGLCEIPDAINRPFGKDAYSENIKRSLRPPSAQNDFLVIGIGDISPVSGVDLFVSLAAATGANTKEKKLRFVWIGDTFDPKEGSEFSALLADQMERLGVSDHCQIIGDAGECIEYITQADVLVLASRLSSSIDTYLLAMEQGIPVLCFDKASSLAEYLAADDMAAGLVQPYLDIHAMAARLEQLANDQAYLDATGLAVKRVVKKTFDLEQYVIELTRLGQEAAHEARAIDADYQAIINAKPPVFSPDLYTSSWPIDDYQLDPLRTYLLRSRISRSGTQKLPENFGRPVRGFNPLIYIEDQLKGDKEVEPLAHWLAFGRQRGRWTHQVIGLSNATSVSAQLKVLLHGHFYYIDLLDECLNRLNANDSVIDLIITVDNEARAESAQHALDRQPIKGNYEIRIVDNIGRDIAPFISGLDRQKLAQYDVIGHVHGKKSPHIDTSSGDQWRSFLWEHLLGGKSPAADVCLQAFENDPKLGLIFPENPNLFGWGNNLETATSLTRRMGRTIPLPYAFEWPIGTMFWARRDALEPLFALGLDWSDYPTEPLPGDGTLLHALERIVPFAVEEAGFTCAASSYVIETIP